MTPEIIQQIPALGVGGLLFVMWWHERKERQKAEDGVQAAATQTALSADISERLLSVVQANTEALTVLRAEIRAQRANETEWITRLTEQLNRMEPIMRQHYEKERIKQ